MTRKFFFFPLLLLALAAVCPSCDDDETYADMRKREDKQIKAFLNKGTQVKDDDSDNLLLDVPAPIKVITENEFYSNDSTTDVSKNEYVKFDKSGVYMQIVEKGTGSRLAEGETKEIITRHIEFNIAADSVQTTNVPSSFEWRYDVMACTNSYGTYSATFTRDLGVMRTSYNSAAVPAGWLIPLKYINLARTMDGPDARLAKVRLIVPSSQGQANASANVYPCFYEIIYQRGAGY